MCLDRRRKEPTLEHIGSPNRHSPAARGSCCRDARLLRRRSRRADRERCSAVNPSPPRRRTLRSPVDRHRLHADVLDATAVLGHALRPGRSASSLWHRDGLVRARVIRMRSGADTHRPDRGSRGSGHRGRHDHADLAGADPRGVSRRHRPGARDRLLGSRWLGRRRRRPGRRRTAHAGRLALDLRREPAGGRARSADAGSRVTFREAARSVRPDWPGHGRACAGRLDLRDHRGWRLQLQRPAGSYGLRGGDHRRRRLCCLASPRSQPDGSTQPLSLSLDDHRLEHRLRHDGRLLRRRVSPEPVLPAGTGPERPGDRAAVPADDRNGRIAEPARGTSDGTHRSTSDHADRHRDHVRRARRSVAPLDLRSCLGRRAVDGANRCRWLVHRSAADRADPEPGCRRPGRHS
jgi:hypothetical protein